jgi:hypothetical protein
MVGVEEDEVSAKKTPPFPAAIAVLIVIELALLLEFVHVLRT